MIYWEYLVNILLNIKLLITSALRIMLGVCFCVSRVSLRTLIWKYSVSIPFLVASHQ